MKKSLILSNTIGYTNVNEASASLCIFNAPEQGCYNAKDFKHIKNKINPVNYILV